MPERVDTIVIGAGQAGLATSYFLTQHGREHLVLERGQVANTWRTQRWDGFYLNTPNWAQQLPGFHYEGDRPDDFAPLSEVIEYLEGYAASTGAPVQTGAEVTALRLEDEYLVDANGRRLHAANVVVAAGSFQRQAPRPLAEAVAADVLQLHTSEYRNPDQLPAGAVLIVGSGQSGCQIADELIQAGWTVYLSTGRCPWFPRRYRGRELVHWLGETGLLDQTVDTLPSPAARLACNPAVSGNDGGHDCNPRWLAARGAVLAGRLEGFDGPTALFAPDLEQNLAVGDEFIATLRRRVDEYVAAAGLDVRPAEEEAPHAPPASVDRLDLRDAGVGTILWATGFRPDLDWIELPVADSDGWPLQKRGVTPFPGLYFVGVNWMHKRKSALFIGVGEDAEHVVEYLVRRTPVDGD